MDVRKKREILKNCTLATSVGRMYIRGKGIDKYIDNSTGDVTLVLVTMGGKWLDAVSPTVATYEQMVDESADDTDLLVRLGNRFFDMQWGAHADSEY